MAMLEVFEMHCFTDAASAPSTSPLRPCNANFVLSCAPCLIALHALATLRLEWYYLFFPLISEEIKTEEIRG